MAPRYSMHALVFFFVCTMTIDIASANTHVFDATIETNEEEPIKTLANVAVAGNLQQVLGDTSGLSYSIMMGDAYLDVDSNTGDIRPKSKLDIEAMCRAERTETVTCNNGKLTHKFTAIVRNPSKKLVARGSFTLIVHDVNDNAPVFAQTLYEEKRDESVCPNVAHFCPNKLISLPAARDNDLSQQYNSITYSMDPFNMTSQTSTDFKLVSPASGAPNLEIVTGIDAERIDKYEFTLVARDADGNEGRTRILVTINDVNDNVPKFNQSGLNVTVAEDAPRGSVIYTLTATDLDKNHNFAFMMDPTTAEAAKRHFAVMPDGKITIASPLDYETQREFKIHVKVQEEGLFDSAVVNVKVLDVNDNPPQYKETAPLELEEGRLPGDVVGEVQVTDRDSGRGGQFQCDTTSQHGNSQQRLKFAPNTDVGEGNFKIYAMATVDRETDAIVTATLTCWDRGEPSLTSTFTATVTIRDRNDNAPVFSRVGPTGVIEAENRENNQPNQRVLQLAASDADEGENARVTYRLAGDSAHADVFSVEPDTGFVRARVQLDRELKDVYELRVVAMDNGQPAALSSTARLRIRVLDENDNAPRFTGAADFQVEENREPGALLGRLTAEDPDLGANGQVRFLQLNSRYKDLFTLDQDGTLRTNAKFDREEISSYSIQVQVQDRGSPPLTSDRVLNIHILDVNDEAPVIVSPGNDSRVVRISIYTHQVGSVVMRIRAIDKDEGLNGQIVYGLAQQQARNKFSINPHTGEILVAKQLDMADLNRFKLMVEAKDSAKINPKSVAKVVYIDVDDSAPPVNLLDEAELAAAHTRRNVIIIIILAAVSAVLAIILIVAITCVNRPCCGAYGDAAGSGRGKRGGGGGNQRRSDGIVDGAGVGGGDMQYTEQAQHLTVMDSEMAWAGSGVHEHLNMRAATMGSHSPLVTTSFALPQGHDPSCYYGGGGVGGGGGGGGGACSTLPNPRHQVPGEKSCSSRVQQQARPGQAKSDQVNFWLYQIKEDGAASPQMQHPRYYQQQPQPHSNFCTISRGQHQVVQYGPSPQQQQQQHHPNHPGDQPAVDGAQSDSGRGCSDEDLSTGPGYYQPGGAGPAAAAGAGTHHHQLMIKAGQRDPQQQQQQQAPVRFTPVPTLNSIQTSRSTPLPNVQQQQQQSKPPTPQPQPLATVHAASTGHSASPVTVPSSAANQADQVCRQIDSLFFKDMTV